MREAYLSGPVFHRSKPLSNAEQLLLTQAQEPANKAQYSYYDCETHGIFSVKNELGLAEIACPRRGKCNVREIFDAAGYAEHYTEPPALPAPVPEPVTPLAAAAAAPVDFPPAELKRRLERVLGVEIPADPEAIAQGFREGLAFIDYHQEQRPESDEPDEPAPPPEPELTDIEHYASLMFAPAEICTILGLDYAQVKGTPEFEQQLLRGELIQKAKLRANIFLHANNGSAPAQLMAAQLIEYATVAKAGRDE